MIVCFHLDFSTRVVFTNFGGLDPPNWDFSKHPAADITVINIGTNDFNPVNNITSAEFTASYIQLINEIHARWPKSQIIVLSLWEGFGKPPTHPTAPPCPHTSPF